MGRGRVELIAGRRAELRQIRQSTLYRARVSKIALRIFLRGLAVQDAPRVDYQSEKHLVNDLIDGSIKTAVAFLEKLDNVVNPHYLDDTNSERVGDAGARTDRPE